VKTFISMSKKDRGRFCKETEGKIGLPAASIEKDFWVCWTLEHLFTLPQWGEHLTFKGGTSLSKGWKLIDRFSEDIDIVITRDFLGFGGTKAPEAAPSKKQTKLRLEALKTECRKRISEELQPALEQTIAASLPAGEKWQLTPASIDEDPDQQTLLFHYPETLAETSAYLRPIVKIEMGARSDTEPAEKPQIIPYLAEAFPEVFGPCSFEVRVLAPERTFWEKAMLLHEETYRPAGKTRKPRLARHYYDLWCLIKKGIAARAVQHKDIFIRTAKHREVYFNWSWMDYTSLKQGTLRILPLKEQEASWRQDYQAMAGEMFFGDIPGFNEILQVIGEFERSFNKG